MEQDNRALLVLLGAVIILAVMGAGVVGHALPIAVVLLCVYQASSQLHANGGTDVATGRLAACIVALVVFTAIPLPSWLDWIGGRDRVAQNGLVREAIEKTIQSGITGGFSPHFALTRNRAGTARMIMIILAGFTAAALAASLRGKRRRQCLEMLVITVAIIAVGGYVSQWILPQGKTIWWSFPVEHGRPVACFVNRNHFGGFVAMLCPAAAMLCLDNMTKRRIVSGTLWGACFVVMGLAVVMSLSRGAWIAFAASMAFVTLAGLARKRFILAIGSVLLIAGVVFAAVKLSNEKLEQRMDNLLDSSAGGSAVMRVNTWYDALKILPDYPVIGVGANAFRMIFPQYRTAATRKLFFNVENEYIQMLVETGVLGVILVAGLLLRIGRRWRENRASGELERTVDLAVAGAAVVVFVHAALDFAFRIPLYFVTFSILVGLVVSSPDYCAAARRKTAMESAMLAVLALVVVFVVGAQWNRIYVMDSPEFIEKAGPKELCRALEWSPTSWHTWYYMGKASSLPGKEGLALSEEFVANATRYDPNNYKLWEQVVRMKLWKNDIPGARQAYRHLKSLCSWMRIPELEKMENHR